MFGGLYVVIAIDVFITLLVILGCAVHSVNHTDENEYKHTRILDVFTPWAIAITSISMIWLISILGWLLVTVYTHRGAYLSVSSISANVMFTVAALVASCFITELESCYSFVSYLVSWSIAACYICLIWMFGNDEWYGFLVQLAAMFVTGIIGFVYIELGGGDGIPVGLSLFLLAILTLPLIGQGHLDRVRAALPEDTEADTEATIVIGEATVMVENSTVIMETDSTDSLEESTTDSTDSIEESITDSYVADRVEPPSQFYYGYCQGELGVEGYYNLNYANGDCIIRNMREFGYSQDEYPCWLRADGVYMLGDYVMCCASLDSGYDYGDNIPTSMGEGIVCDFSRFGQQIVHKDWGIDGTYVLEIYTNWN